MDIDVVRPRDLASEEIACWSRLQSAAADLASPFLSPHWPRVVETAQTGAFSQLRVAILHERGSIRGFFPARVAGGAAMPAGAPMCDYQGVIAEEGAEFEARALLAALGVGRYDFTHMPQSQTAFAGHIRELTPSWIARLPYGYDVYAADKKAESGIIKDMDKRRRKVEREVAPITFTAFSRSRTDFDRLIEWKQRSMRETGQTDIFATGWTVRLLRELFGGLDPEFGGVLFTLHIGDELAAAHFHLRSANTIHAWIIDHNPAFDRFSPGLLLFQDIMRWMDDTPYTTLDFGPGDYRFKRQLANDACQVGHGFVGRPSGAALMRGAIYTLRDAAERLPLGKVSTLPGKAMRRLDVIRALR